MTQHSKTLLFLLASGFDGRTSRYRVPTVAYSFQFLDLEASDAVNMYQQPVVELGGILNTGRVLAEVCQSIPSDLESTEAATAWVSYSLRSYRRELEPLPEWYLAGEHHWDLIAAVQSQRMYQERPRCSIDRDHARLLRTQLRAAIKVLGGIAEPEVMFDGNIVTFRLGE